MARIRTIKPEFWDSPSVGKAGPWARLAFIAMWNWADDYGRGTLNYKELEGFVFPFDSEFTDRSGNTVNFRSVVAEVSACFDVALYEVDGRHYYAIPSWDKHQRNERRSKGSKYPDPSDGTPLTTGGTEVHGISATEERKYSTLPQNSSLGTGEQGNRGTGEQVTLAHSARKSLAPLAERFDEWWEAYPRKIGKAKAETAYGKAVAAGTPEEELIAKARTFARVSANTAKQYIPHPTTWLNRASWQDDMSAYLSTPPPDRNAQIIERAFANYDQRLEIEP